MDVLILSNYLHQTQISIDYFRNSFAIQLQLLTKFLIYYQNIHHHLTVFRILLDDLSY
jgi:hypothetical protein